MSLKLTILYRGPLSSCNYRCHYCPFAKRHETAKELAIDRQALTRFADWIESRSRDRLSVLFTPWGEAMTRPWYRETLARISHWPQTDRVAIQTNLSWDVSWTRQCNLQRLGLWCTWHPTQVTQAAFARQCKQLDRIGVTYSVGMVGLREAYQQAIELRSLLDPSVYLWINAYKDVQGYYSVDEIEQWTRIDPWFPINLQNHASYGQACRTGNEAISVDGDGNIRRCHFIPTVLGNLYEDEFEAVLRPRTCTNRTCECHIGYVHLESLALDRDFEDGMLMRSMNLSSRLAGGREGMAGGRT